MLEMTLQETMAVLSFASKSAEMLEDNLKAQTNPMNLTQWRALAEVVRPILKRLDTDNPAMLPLPHDGVGWKDRP
jgi:hypothetical protein